MPRGWEDNRRSGASHWPCVTDSVVYPPTGSAIIKKTHPAYASVGYGTFSFN